MNPPTISSPRQDLNNAYYLWVCSKSDYDSGLLLFETLKSENPADAFCLLSKLVDKKEMTVKLAINLLAQLCGNTTKEFDEEELCYEIVEKICEKYTRLAEKATEEGLFVEFQDLVVVLEKQGFTEELSTLLKSELGSFFLSYRVKIVEFIQKSNSRFVFEMFLKQMIAATKEKSITSSTELILLWLRIFEIPVDLESDSFLKILQDQSLHDALQSQVSTEELKQFNKGLVLNLIKSLECHYSQNLLNSLSPAIQKLSPEDVKEIREIYFSICQKSQEKKLKILFSHSVAQLLMKGYYSKGVIELLNKCKDPSKMWAHINDIIKDSDLIQDQKSELIIYAFDQYPICRDGQSFDNYLSLRNECKTIFQGDKIHIIYEKICIFYKKTQSHIQGKNFRSDEFINFIKETLGLVIEGKISQIGQDFLQTIFKVTKGNLPSKVSKLIDQSIKNELKSPSISIDRMMLLSEIQKIPYNESSIASKTWPTIWEKKIKLRWMEVGKACELLPNSERPAFLEHALNRYFKIRNNLKLSDAGFDEILGMIYTHCLYASDIERFKSHIESLLTSVSDVRKKIQVLLPIYELMKGQEDSKRTAELFRIAQPFVLEIFEDSSVSNELKVRILFEHVFFLPKNNPSIWFAENRAGLVSLVKAALNRKVVCVQEPFFWAFNFYLEQELYPLLKSSYIKTRGAGILRLMHFLFEVAPPLFSVEKFFKYIEDLEHPLFEADKTKLYRLTVKLIENIRQMHIRAGEIYSEEAKRILVQYPEKLMKIVNALLASKLFRSAYQIIVQGLALLTDENLQSVLSSDNQKKEIDLFKKMLTECLADRIKHHPELGTCDEEEGASIKFGMMPKFQKKILCVEETQKSSRKLLMYDQVLLHSMADSLIEKACTEGTLWYSLLSCASSLLDHRPLVHILSKLDANPQFKDLVFANFLNHSFICNGPDNFIKLFKEKKIINSLFKSSNIENLREKYINWFEYAISKIRLGSLLRFCTFTQFAQFMNHAAIKFSDQFSDRPELKEKMISYWKIFLSSEESRALVEQDETVLKAMIDCIICSDHLKIANAICSSLEGKKWNEVLEANLSLLLCRFKSTTIFPKKAYQSLLKAIEILERETKMRFELPENTKKVFMNTFPHILRNFDFINFDRLSKPEKDKFAKNVLTCLEYGYKNGSDMSFIKDLKDNLDHIFKFSDWSRRYRNIISKSLIENTVHPH